MVLFHEELKHMKISVNLPNVNSFKYVENHHYLELEDKNGNSTKMLPRHFCKYVCEKCKIEFFMCSNYGKIRCPCCGDFTVASAWGSLQIGFMPEQESEFDGLTTDVTSPPCNDKNKE